MTALQLIPIIWVERTVGQGSTFHVALPGPEK